MKSIFKLQTKKTSILLLFFFTLATGFAQNGKGVFIGSLANQMPPHISAALEVYSNDKGFLIPRMDSVQRLAITPSASDNRASGLMVYDTDNKCVYVWRKGYNVNPTECWFSLCNSDMSMTPGPEGPQGPKGDTGVAGPQGPAGNSVEYYWNGSELCIRVIGDLTYTCVNLGGPTGPQGPAGIDGANGLDGAQGPQGPAGPAGPDGPQGPQGPQGDMGIDGPPGNSIEYYWNGTELCVRVVGDPLFTCIDLLGPRGPQGPAGIDGANGLDGAQGATGATGPAGPQGPQGIQGPQGDMGVDGPPGNSIEYYWNGTELCVRVVGDPLFTCVELSGPQGPQGTPGIDGANGLDGAQGATGPAGPAGPQGPQGIQGPQGDIGEVGPVGCNTPNFILKNDGITATCSEIYEDDFQNVGLGTTIPATKLDINGNIALRANSSIPQITTDLNNFNIGSSTFVRLFSDAVHNFTGIANGVDGQILIITNVGSFDIILQNENSASLGNNQFILSTSADIPLAPRHTITLIYDAASAGWRDISFR